MLRPQMLDARAYPPSESKRSFRLGVANGVLFSAADAFFESNTIIPVFISRLTSSNVLIGLSSSIANLGWFLPQVFTSHLLQTRAYRKPFYTYAAYVRVGTLAGLALLIHFLGSTHPNLLLGLFFLLFTAYALGGGFAGVSFMDIVGKTIPPDRRGYFWGYRLFGGGILAVLAGIAVKFALGSFLFPQSYALLFGVGSLFVLIAVMTFIFVREPPSEVPEHPLSFSEHLRLGARIFSKDHAFRHLLYFRLSLGLWAMAQPFYVIYAKRVLGVPDSTAGLFLSIQIAGSILTNLLWGCLSRTRGDRFLLETIAGLALLVPAIVLGGSLAPQGLRVYLLYPAFFFVGATLCGLAIGYTNLLLEIAPEVSRPLYVGFMNALITPTAFLPALGGIVVNLFGFPILFATALLSALLASMAAARLKRSRSI
jgi:MFS family permease